MKQYFEPSAEVLLFAREDVLNVSGELADIISPLEQEEVDMGYSKFNGFQ